MRGNGVGGRNSAFALDCVDRIAGKGIAVLSAGTDGKDGSSPAAGAVADGQRWKERSRQTYIRKSSPPEAIPTASSTNSEMPLRPDPPETISATFAYCLRKIRAGGGLRRCSALLLLLDLLQPLVHFGQIPLDFIQPLDDLLIWAAAAGHSRGRC